MSDIALNSRVGVADGRPHLDRKPHRGGALVFFLVLIAGLTFAAFSIVNDVNSVGEHNIATGALVLLGIALVIALGFEFVNGFHDTANAVATVIYTHSLPPLVAVIWSGLWNFPGVLTSSGAVAYTVVTLLPVELILQVGSGAGYAMIFALLLAAMIWNLGTWAFGLPNSSSHALIGSIMGVGLANQILAPKGVATSGVDWDQALGVFKALLFSPVIGFVLSALLLLVMKFVVRSPTLYKAPEGTKPPPTPIRALLVLTCTGVSFFHGGNDGQKGMGLIMLILIGAAPTAYALNRTMPESAHAGLRADGGRRPRAVFTAHAGSATSADAAAARDTVGEALKTKELNSPEVYAALRRCPTTSRQQVKNYGSIKPVPAAATPNLRNDMYLADDAVRLLGASPAGFSADENGNEGIADGVRGRHALHPGLGEGLRRAGARPGHDGRLEAHRGDGRREDRQDASDLRAGRLGRNRGDGNDRPGRSLRPAGLDHPHPVQRRRRHDGGQRLRPAMAHDPQHAPGLGPDPAGRHADRRVAFTSCSAKYFNGGGSGPGRSGLARRPSAELMIKRSRAENGQA